MYTVEWHIRYLAESKRGDVLDASTILVSADPKRMRLHTLLSRTDGTAIATGEVVLPARRRRGRRRDPDARRSLAQGVAAMLAAHASLPRPDHLGLGVGAPRQAMKERMPCRARTARRPLTSSRRLTPNQLTPEPSAAPEPMMTWPTRSSRQTSSTRSRPPSGSGTPSTSTSAWSSRPRTGPARRCGSPRSCATDGPKPNAPPARPSTRRPTTVARATSGCGTGSRRRSRTEPVVVSGPGRGRSVPSRSRGSARRSMQYGLDRAAADRSAGVSRDRD